MQGVVKKQPTQPAKPSESGQLQEQPGRMAVKRVPNMQQGRKPPRSSDAPKVSEQFLFSVSLPLIVAVAIVSLISAQHLI